MDMPQNIPDVNNLYSLAPDFSNLSQIGSAMSNLQGYNRQLTGQQMMLDALGNPTLSQENINSFRQGAILSSPQDAVNIGKDIFAEEGRKRAMPYIQKGQENQQVMSDAFNNIILLMKRAGIDDIADADVKLNDLNTFKDEMAFQEQTGKGKNYYAAEKKFKELGGDTAISALTTLKDEVNKYNTAFNEQGNVRAQLSNIPGIDASTETAATKGKPLASAVADYWRNQSALYGLQTAKYQAQTAPLGVDAAKLAIEQRKQDIAYAQAQEARDRAAADRAAAAERRAERKEGTEQKLSQREALKEFRNTTVDKYMKGLLYPSQYNDVYSAALSALNSPNPDAYSIAKYLGAVVEPGSAVQEGEVKGWSVGGTSSQWDEWMNKFGLSQSTAPSKIFSTLVGQLKSKQESAIAKLKGALGDNVNNPTGLTLQNVDPAYTGSIIKDVGGKAGTKPAAVKLAPYQPAKKTEQKTNLNNLGNAKTTAAAVKNISPNAAKKTGGKVIIRND
jgi:hypothetical protein